MQERPDQITTAVAAALLGISDSMMRRVIRLGYVTAHARGLTTIRSAVSGYAAFLRDDARTSASSAAAARSHAARAAKTRMATARRMQHLVPRAEGEEVIEVIAEGAVKTLAAFKAPTGLSPATLTALKAAMADGIARIAEARDAALVALRTGVFHD